MSKEKGFLGAEGREHTRFSATVFSREDSYRDRGDGKRRLTIIDSHGKIQEVILDALGKDRIRFGSDPSRCDIVFDARFVSRLHGELKVSKDKVLFADQNSTNGTYLEANGSSRFLHGDNFFYELNDGNILRIQGRDARPDRTIMLLYTESSEKGSWRRFPVQAGDVTIGRGAENSIVLSHPGVSRRHAFIRKQGDHCILVDYSSKNGILLNGKSVNKSAVLQEKDVITILNSTLIYTDQNIFYKTSRQGTHIQIRNVNKYVGKDHKQILNHVNCDIESNDFVAIIGGSGAGKTTLMNAISGFDRKVEGSIRYNGTELRNHFKEWKSMIGYVPQEDIIFENLNLRRMLTYTADLKMPPDTSRQEKEKRISQVLAMVELTAHQNTLIRKLSGGQKKRASIAVELLADPGVFFLDEPTSGLDPGTEQKLMQTLSRLSKKEGKTIIMVTHTTQSLELCDKVIFMGQGGRICFYGTTAEAKEYFGSPNLVDIYNMISDEADKWSEKYGRTFPVDSRGPLSRGGKDKLKKRNFGLQFKQFPILTMRYMELMKNDPSRLGVLLLQPILIALLLAMVANEDVFDIYDDTKSILFSLSCAGIWIGLFNSIQEICKERAILKREYMGDLKLPWYVLSKFAVQTLLGMIQAGLMTTIFTMKVGQAEQGILWDNPNIETFLTLWLTIEASMALGFVISSLVKSGDKAMTLAPFILIIQLLFAGILFELDGISEYFSYVTISKWSVESLGSIAHLNDLTKKIQEQIPTAEHEFEEIFESSTAHLMNDWRILLAMTGICMILCMILLRRISKDGR